MAAAIALAVVLVIAVAGMSLAMQAQRPLAPNQPRPGRPTRTTRTPRPPVPGRARRARERAAPPSPPPTPAPDVLPPMEAKGPELLRTGVPARAKVLSVVDERVVGPVTRSRLTLTIEPAGGATFEVTIRHAFATVEARARVKVGGTVAVRYDRDEHRKVVIDPEGD